MADAHTVRIPTLPDAIPRDALQTICDTLGLPADQVRSLDIDFENVTAALYACDEQGRKLAHGDGPVVIAVSIPVR